MPAAEDRPAEILRPSLAWKKSQAKIAIKKGSGLFGVFCFALQKLLISFAHERLNSLAHEAGIRTIRRSPRGCLRRRRVEGLAFSFLRR